MKRLNIKGFTLIELMIVMAIIAVLSVVLIPKVLPLKNQAKNNAVQANVYVVRSFLENRAGTDKISINSSLLPNMDATLGLIKNNIGIAMTSTFSGSSELKNPFNNSTTIDYINSNIQTASPGNLSVAIYYDTASIPTNVSNITNVITTPGVTVIILYQTGYVIYGVDSSGGIVQSTLVNMPSRVAQTPLDNPLQPQITTPIFSYTFDSNGGTYTLSCDTPNVEIRYTIDGTQPNSTSLKYNVPITVATNTTIKAYALDAVNAVNVRLRDSNVLSTTYNPPQVATPTFNYTFDSTGGSYTLSCVTPNNTIRYTTNGTEPISSYLIYTGPIPVTTTTTIKTYAQVEGLMNSNVASITYTVPITIPITPPSFYFNGNFAAGNNITKGTSVTFSITLTPSNLGGIMKVTTDDGSVNDNGDGNYTFTAPNGNKKVCTIMATLTIDNQNFVGKLVLTTN